MFLTKKALECHRIAAKDGLRYGINGVLVRPDGSIVATDGHRLIVYTPKGVPPNEDSPKIEGVSNDADAPELEPFVLPVEACKTIGKALPRKSHLPILALAQVDTAATNANGCATIGVTDLENPQVFKPAKIEGSFPRYENVIPKPENELAFVAFSVDYLISIGQTLKAQGFKCVRLSMQKPDETPEPDDHGKLPPFAKTENKPVTFDATNEDGTVKVVLMPMHLC